MLEFEPINGSISVPELVPNPSTVMDNFKSDSRKSSRTASPAPTPGSTDSPVPTPGTAASPATTVDSKQEDSEGVIEVNDKDAATTETKKVAAAEDEAKTKPDEEVGVFFY